ncbi:hypothetical protein [Mycoplasmopsis columboralis]|uniref:Uncharacterized protein n=1 Tax=Mycoplasmopsis columboralis TaxID=171282 RepID=A0A449B6A7_9BACT|nr:hypothetical protein [Mycoplasmopsis columboralis]VEU76137.1 Uncharacterised protein [Mycoplasmopsis columboralis]
MTEFKDKIKFLKSARTAGMFYVIWQVVMFAFLILGIIISAFNLKTISQQGLLSAFAFPVIVYLIWFLGNFVSGFFVMYKAFYLYEKVQKWNLYEQTQISTSSLLINKISVIIGVGTLPLGIGFFVLLACATSLWVKTLTIEKQLLVD